MQKSIVWEGLDNDTEEHCAVNYLDKGIMVRSEIEGWAGHKVAVYAEYTLKLDTAWNVLEFEIIFHLADNEHKYHMQRDAAGKWTDSDGKHRPEFDGCDHIDISLTPFTNTLPVNGLHFEEGQTREVDVLYIDVLENVLRRDTQKYTKTSQNTYRFENEGGNFIAEITVDDDGFVTFYPGLFEMLKPK